jgi:hypothetical protein
MTRIRFIDDLYLDLERLVSAEADKASTSSPKRRSSWMLATAVGGAAVVSAALIGISHMNSTHGHSATSPGQLPVGSQGRWSNDSIPQIARFGSVPSYTTYSLNGVSASAPTRAWIVGQRPTGPRNGTAPFAWRWNGGKWIDVRVNTPADRAGLYAVADIDDENAWAVGVVGDNGAGQGGRPLVMHWDGSQWRSVRIPDVGAGILYAVAVRSHNDVWAAGRRGVGTSLKTDLPLVLHFDGQRWRYVSSQGAVRGALGAVQALGAHNVWFTTSRHESPGPAILHWDGARFKLIPNPFPAPVSSQNVAFSPTGEATAVGYRRGACTTSHAIPLSARWDGERWTDLPTPAEGTDSTLGLVATTRSGGTWAIGQAALIRYSPDSCHLSNASLAVRYSSFGLVFQHWDGRHWAIEDRGIDWGPVSSSWLDFGSTDSAMTLVGSTGWFIATDPYDTVVAKLRQGHWYLVDHPVDRRPW